MEIDDKEWDLAVLANGREIIFSEYEISGFESLAQYGLAAQNMFSD